MSNFKRGIATNIKNNIQKEQKQNQLKIKHNVAEDSDILIVEKSNMVKFTVMTFQNLIKTIASLLLCFFAAIGVITLIYPSSRVAFLEVVSVIWSQLISFLS